MMSDSVMKLILYCGKKLFCNRTVHIIVSTALPNMGLTTWKNAPQGRIRKSDVSIAKNYLNEEEMINLNEIVTADQIEWVRRMNSIRNRAEEIVLHELVYDL